jgi:hypothetical protein
MWRLCTASDVGIPLCLDVGRDKIGMDFPAQGCAAGVLLVAVCAVRYRLVM